MPTKYKPKRYYLDNSIPADNTAQIGRQQINRATSTKLSKTVSYSISAPNTQNVLNKIAPRSVFGARARHKQLSNYYFKQAPTLGNLVKGVEHWAKANRILEPDETGLVTGYAPSPNKISTSPIKLAIKYPKYVRDLGNKLNGAKQTLGTVGRRIGNSINSLLDDIKLRYAYLGSRGGKVKNFNSDDPLRFYRDRTGRSISDMELDKIPESKVLDTPSFYDIAVRSYVSRSSKDDLRAIYKAIEDKFGWPHLSGRDKAGFFDDFVKSRRATLDYVKGYKDLLRLTPIWKRFDDQLNMMHSMHLGAINKVGLPKYSKSKINDMIWSHEDAHLLDLLSILKKHKVKDFNELMNVAGDEAFWGGNAINSGAYHWLDDSRLNNSLINYYYDHMKGTELAARGTQLKNYFGLMKGQRLTPAMLKYAKKHYVNDIGHDNSIQEMLDNITDYKKAAAWFNNFSHKYGGVIKK